MSSGQAVFRRATSRKLAVSALLVLPGWLLPALAFAGLDVICDESRKASLDELDAPELNIQIVDHGAASSMTAASPITAGKPSHFPEIELMLRDILKAPELNAPILPKALARRNGKSAPLADATDVQDPGNAPRQDKAQAGTPAEDATIVSPRLPGVSADDLVRFRKQMFRNDI